MNINDKYLSHLLANPYHMKKKKKEEKLFIIDNEILLLLKKKYNYEITDNDIPLIFEKIEKILVTIHQTNIIHDVVNNLIDNTINNILNE
tara:strand:- start:2564 stop:2833 length:270 start_codon:yes stop_codon:yes gene_type:complete